MNSLLTEYDEEKVMAQIGQEFFEEGEAKGEAKAEQRYNQLILKLAKDNRTELIVKAASDAKLLEDLFREYGL